MSRDKLEQFIRDNRDEFDEFEPNPALFAGVKTRKAKLIMGKWNSIAWKAAAAVAIFVSSYFFHDWVNAPDQASMAAVNEEQEKPSEIFKVLMEAEMYYTSKINSKKEEFYHLSSSNPGIREEIDSELVDLDKVYAELKCDLKDNAANEEVIEAMIQNYRIKLEILEDVLQQINEANNPKSGKEDDYETEL
ncbi:MAG: hypothetical protein K9H16_12180 [Bacteroidales bacterium]|nr:hypothetical protein [Bacteroidales bacterium]